jgi:hypothetical protein
MRGPIEMKRFVSDNSQPLGPLIDALGDLAV